MSKPIVALVLVQQCRCLRCNYRWRDSSLLFRMDSGAYSYHQSNERMQALADGSLPISGRRTSKRAVGACHSCAPLPEISVWEGQLTYDYFDGEPQPVAARKRRSGRDPAQQALINSLFED